MSKLVTTNLRFPEATYRELRYQAGRRRVPLATLVREAVDRYLGRTDEGTTVPLGSDPADEIIGKLTGSAGDESVNHDHYLYGWPKETDGETAGRHQRAPGSRDAGRPEPRSGRPPRAAQPPRPPPRPPSDAVPVSSHSDTPILPLTQCPSSL